MVKLAHVVGAADASFPRRRNMLSRRMSSAIVVAGLFAIPALVLGQTQSQPARSSAPGQARSGRGGADERAA